MKASVIEREKVEVITPSARARRVRPVEPSVVTERAPKVAVKKAAATVTESAATKRRKVGSVVGAVMMNGVLFAAVYLIALAASTLFANVRIEQARISALSAEKGTRVAVKSTEATSRKLAALDAATDSWFGPSSLEGVAPAPVSPRHVFARR